MNLNFITVLLDWINMSYYIKTTICILIGINTLHYIYQRLNSKKKDEKKDEIKKKYIDVEKKVIQMLNMDINEKEQKKNKELESNFNELISKKELESEINFKRDELISKKNELVLLLDKLNNISDNIVILRDKLENIPSEIQTN